MLMWRLTSLERLGTVGILHPDPRIYMSLIYMHFYKRLGVRAGLEVWWLLLEGEGREV